MTERAPLLAIFESGAFHGLAHIVWPHFHAFRVAGGMNFTPAPHSKPSKRDRRKIRQFRGEDGI